MGSPGPTEQPVKGRSQISQAAGLPLWKSSSAPGCGAVGDGVWMGPEVPTGQRAGRLSFPHMGSSYCCQRPGEQALSWSGRLQGSVSCCLGVWAPHPHATQSWASPVAPLARQVWAPEGQAQLLLIAPSAGLHTVLHTCGPAAARTPHCAGLRHPHWSSWSAGRGAASQTRGRGQ